MIRFRKRWILWAVLALPYLLEMPGCVMAHCPKFGRVVDSSTGEGIAGAAVIVTAEYTKEPVAIPGVYLESRGSVTTEYRVVSYTNSYGFYWVESTWLQLDPGHFTPFLGGMSERWKLTVFKPGYILDSDERAFRTMRDSNGQPIQKSIVSQHVSLHERPSSFLLGPITRINNIYLHPIDWDVANYAEYYRSIVMLGANMIIRKTKIDENGIRKMGYEFFLPKICALDPQQELNWWSSILFFTDNNKFLSNLRKLHPSGFTVREKFPVVSSGDQTFLAHEVCQSMLGAKV
jgi:hypothetical protein